MARRGRKKNGAKRQLFQKKAEDKISGGNGTEEPYAKNSFGGDGERDNREEKLGSAFKTLLNVSAEGGTGTASAGGGVKGQQVLCGVPTGISAEGHPVLRTCFQMAGSLCGQCFLHRAIKDMVVCSNCRYFLCATCFLNACFCTLPEDIQTVKSAKLVATVELEPELDA